MVSEIRTVLTEFVRILSKSNIPIENHRSVKVSYMSIWNRWLNMMRRMIDLEVIQDLMELIVSVVNQVYTQTMVPRLGLYSYS
jgi:chemotaxis regulatin CheY-phosphate phosphatase CheZ